MNFNAKPKRKIYMQTPFKHFPILVQVSHGRPMGVCFNLLFQNVRDVRVARN